MAWYIEYDNYPFSDRRCTPQRQSLALDCPNDIKARKEARIEAVKQLKQYNFDQPILVWKEPMS